MLAIIPARGGSKGIHKKNLVKLHGHTLLYYTIQEAKKSKYISDIILSTDDVDIAEEGSKCGLNVNYKRPFELAQDNTSMVDTLIHCLEWVTLSGLPHKNFMLLQPTSPLRVFGDIDGAIEKYQSSGKVSLVSVSRMKEHPFECIKLSGKGEWSYLVPNSQAHSRRQDYENNFFFINGAIYISSIEHVLTQRTVINPKSLTFHQMPTERSIDVDTSFDLLVVSALIKNMAT